MGQKEMNRGDGIDEITDAVESPAENAERVSGLIDDAAGLTDEMTASTRSKLLPTGVPS